MRKILSGKTNLKHIFSKIAVAGPVCANPLLPISNNINYHHNDPSAAKSYGEYLDTK